MNIQKGSESLEQKIENYASIKPIIENVMAEKNVNMAELSRMIGKSSKYLSNLSGAGITFHAKRQLLILLQGISERGVIYRDLYKYELENVKQLKGDILRLENTINMFQQSNVDIGLYVNKLESELKKIKEDNIDKMIKDMEASNNTTRKMFQNMESERDQLKNELLVCKSERLEYLNELTHFQFDSNEKHITSVRERMFEVAENIEKRKKLSMENSHLKNMLHIARNNIELSFMAGMFLLINFIGFLHAIAVILSGNVGICDVLLGAFNVLGVIFFVCILEDILIDLEV